jgi:hypothetical protein
VLAALLLTGSLTRVQETIARRKPGLCSATQTDPVVDVAVSQLRAQVTDLEQQLRAAHSTLATRSSEMHQREAAERKLRQFAQARRGALPCVSQ